MTVELRPLGVRCNIECQYCYQNPQRDAGNLPVGFDLGRMKAAIERAGANFTIFGGEPLLVPEHVLEELWALGYERFGSNGIQTNATLITDRHIALFKRYNVSVGISVDGPDDLNDARWAGTVARTREATRVARSEWPPRSKKRSSAPTRSTPSTSAQIPASAPSISVRGAT